MLTVDKMKKSLEKAEVAYLQFTLHTRQLKDGLFCFFEGERGTDNPYYIPRIKNYTNSYHPIRCGGRDTVLKVYELITIHREYDKYKKAFFIDKDFNAPVGLKNPPIFETPCYSIENFYVSENVFEEILKSHLNISAIDERFNLFKRIYKERQIEFHNATLLFNAWYSCLVDIRNSTGKFIGVRLDDKFPKELIDFSLEAILPKYTVADLYKMFPDALPVETGILNSRVEEFKQCVQHEVFRGKYELFFVRKFIELIILDSTTTKNNSKTKIDFLFGPLSNDQAISVFSGVAETPDSLDLYLKAVLA